MGVLSVLMTPGGLSDYTDAWLLPLGGTKKAIPWDGLSISFGGRWIILLRRRFASAVCMQRGFSAYAW